MTTALIIVGIVLALAFVLTLIAELTDGNALPDAIVTSVVMVIMVSAIFIIGYGVITIIANAI